MKRRSVHWRLTDPSLYDRSTPTLLVYSNHKQTDECRIQTHRKYKISAISEHLFIHCIDSYLMYVALRYLVFMCLFSSFLCLFSLFVCLSVIGLFLK